MRFSNKPKLKKVLSPEGEEALLALQKADKPMTEIVDWIALDVFRMRKAEDINGEYKITTKLFQIKEIK